MRDGPRHCVGVTLGGEPFLFPLFCSTTTALLKKSAVRAIQVGLAAAGSAVSVSAFLFDDNSIV